jgi:hypothetical protein
VDYPKLRLTLEAFPVEAEGKRLICFRDPLGYTDKLVFIPIQLIDLIEMLDGRHSILDIQSELTRLTGEIVFRDDIEGLIGELDRYLLLDSERFHQIHRRIEQEFASSPVRKAAHAGQSYPAEPEALKQTVEGFFSSRRRETIDVGDTESSVRHLTGEVKGIIAPHIDLRVGGECYTYAYEELATHCAASTFVILGTSHHSMDDLFVVTRKPYDTPLGPLKTDEDFIDRLERNYGGSLSEGQVAHRTEHSIEFQAVFLRYLFQESREVEIVPILCGSFHELVLSRTRPSDDPRICRFVDALRATIKDSSKPVALIAGVDLAHIGRKFGDPFPAEPMLGQLEIADRESLGFVVSLDADGFFHSIAQDADSRKVCGLSPIYLFLAAIDASQGKLLKYEQWHEEATESAVSFASLSFC